MSNYAETRALQTRLVQQLALLRQQELDSLVNRFSTVGVQASLIGGFAIQVLIVEPDISQVHWLFGTLFYLASYACMLASVHAVIVTTFCTAQAPLAALRGRTGALTNALQATREQQQNIDSSFVAALCLFVAQLF